MDDDELIEDEIEAVDLEVDLAEELDDEVDLDEVLVEEELVDEPLDDEVAVPVAEVEEEEEEEAVPTARRRPRAGDEEDEEEDLNPDDVEADLDTILKDRIASGDDDDEDVEPEAPGESGERVAAKTADEFTCQTCFLIVHPRQFGRAGRLTCPEGYDPCSSIPKVEALLKKARKG